MRTKCFFTLGAAITWTRMRLRTAKVISTLAAETTTSAAAAAVASTAAVTDSSMLVRIRTPELRTAEHTTGAEILGTHWNDAIRTKRREESCTVDWNGKKRGKRNIDNADETQYHQKQPRIRALPLCVYWLHNNSWEREWETKPVCVCVRTRTRMFCVRVCVHMSVRAFNMFFFMIIVIIIIQSAVFVRWRVKYCVEFLNNCFHFQSARVEFSRNPNVVQGFVCMIFLYTTTIAAAVTTTTTDFDGKWKISAGNAIH